jgi:hypothetical protein
MHVQQFLPGLRILASAFRLASFTLGQEIRIDFRAVGPAETIAFVESRFHFPGVDFTHENDKNVTLIESLLLSYTPAAWARFSTTLPQQVSPAGRGWTAARQHYCAGWDNSQETAQSRRAMGGVSMWPFRTSWRGETMISYRYTLSVDGTDPVLQPEKLAAEEGGGRYLKSSTAATNS